jgi:hypothetical protein
MVDGTE